MRKLALLSLGVMLGAIPVVFMLPGWMTVLLDAAALVFVILSLTTRLRRDRTSEPKNGKAAVRVAAGFLSAGILFGTGYSLAWRAVFFDSLSDAAYDSLPTAVELTSYPERTEYGYSAYGIVRVGERRARAVVYFTERLSDMEPGDVLIGTGSLSAYDDRTEAGSYHRSIGVPLKLRMRDVSAASISDRGALKYFPQRLSFRMRSRIGELFPEDVRGFLSALLTGSRSGLSSADRSRMKIAGNYHALAVSGMHVSILMTALNLILLKKRRLLPVIGFPVLAIFCLVTGMGASVVRAAVMQLFFIIAPLFNREADSPTALCSAGLLLTLQNPWCLMNSGMQLSFLATAGILLFGERLLQLLTRTKKKSIPAAVGRFFSGSISQTLSATALTLPVMLISFGTFSTFGVLTNLITLPVITWIFSVGMLCVLVSFVLMPLGSVLAVPVLWLVRFVQYVTAKIAAWPFAVMTSGILAFRLWVLALYCLVAACAILYFRASSRFTKAVRCAAGVLAVSFAAILACSLLFRLRREVTLSVLDVGQGECVLLQSENESFVVDCGGSDGTEAGEILCEALLSSGEDTIDYLLLTHYDTDHCGGIEYILNLSRVGALLLPDVPDDTGNRAEIETAAANRSVPVFYVTDDISFQFGKGIAFLYAPVSDEGSNASCLVSMFSFGDYDILITGDLTAAKEKVFLKEHTLPDTEVLVAGHHGAANATSAELLSAVCPETVIISVGENRYGHPAAETLERIQACGADIKRTDLDGTVRIER